MRRITLVCLLLTVLGQGCRRDVGTCIQEDALSVVFADGSGLPMYEGQALVASTCGNGSFCHSADADGVDRFGVAKGLDFDVSVACQFIKAEETCDQASIDRLLEDRALTTDLRGLMVGQVRSKAMPPGKAGKLARAGAPAFVRNSDGTVLPSIDSSEGREIVRNWIACNSPVVGEAVAPAPGFVKGAICDSPRDIGDTDCRVADEPPPPPDPTWDSIYTEVIGTSICLTCHSTPTSSPAALAVLNLGSDKSSALLAMVNRMASGDVGSECAGGGTLIIPGDGDGSLLLQKMTRTQSCGDQMPPSGTFINAGTIDAIRMWIDADALDN